MSQLKEAVTDIRQTMNDLYDSINYYKENYDILQLQYNEKTKELEDKCKEISYLKSKNNDLEIEKEGLSKEIELLQDNNKKLSNSIDIDLAEINSNQKIIKDDFKEIHSLVEDKIESLLENSNELNKLSSIERKIIKAVNEIESEISNIIKDELKNVMSGLEKISSNLVVEKGIENNDYQEDNKEEYIEEIKDQENQDEHQKYYSEEIESKDSQKNQFNIKEDSTNYDILKD